MKTLRVALLQIRPTDNLSQNMEKGIAACQKAKEGGADIALFPEMWSSGYHIPQKKSERLELAVPLDGAFCSCFAKKAAELNMAIGLTLLERRGEAAYNTLVLFDRYGNRVLRYAKVHTCDFGEERCLEAGKDFSTVELDTAVGKVKVGAMICYDREFPESARILMLQGAELILVPNACPMEINRLTQLRARAFENMLGIATCNYPAGHPDCNGHSSAFDGVAWLAEEETSRDTCLLEAGEEEGIFFADFDLECMRRYRACEVHGNAYRRPERYSALVDLRIDPPFVRQDRRP
ncbi:carbon-nitrogen hydrolase family protein [uncultured Ruthenibacterium sp.]|uniref:carbon-nitrogen hydrolase family protein n=1 Tax=uncultured Ruthenibacterium sp. TaxID=1905347 RepID=UPI00349EBC69